MKTTTERWMGYDAIVGYDCQVVVYNGFHDAIYAAAALRSPELSSRGGLTAGSGLTSSARWNPQSSISFQTVFILILLGSALSGDALELSDQTMISLGFCCLCSD